MELVYLWVEDYKNIHKQGFNFSPRFHCEYDDEKNELKIDENKDYIPNFFGENINVTAIVGKNGSGKSTILELLNEILELKDYKAKLLEERKINYLLIYRENNEWQKFSSIDVIHDINIKNNEYINFKHYTYLASEQKYISDYGMFDENNEIDIIKKDRIFLNKYLIAEMVASIYSNKVDFNLTTFMYLPQKFEVVSMKNSFNKYVSKQRSDLDNKDSIDEFDHMVDESFKKTNPYEKFVREWYIMHYNMSIKTYYVGVAAQHYNIDEDELEEFKKHDCFLTEEEYDKYFQKQNKSFNELSEKDENIYFNWYKDEFEFDFIDSQDRRFNNLSHGEQTIFGLFLNLYYISLNNKNKSISFLLDEPDLSLHPEWKRKYISELVPLLQRLKNSFHILFTTHSPFLLSDIPKQNIIFLDTDDDGKCKVLNNDEVMNKKETFGANIHTLLSDSFFMDNGLMGEFAKRKIKTIKVIHQYILHKHKKKFLFTQSCKLSRRLIIKILPKLWQIQKIIGEPFIQKIVQNKLEEIELILLGKNAAIDKEIMRLQALKESLTNG